MSVFIHLKYVKSDVYTVNCGMAYGQAALLLSLGTKGYRAVQPNSSSMIHFSLTFKRLEWLLSAQLFCTSVSYEDDAVFVSLHYIHCNT